MNVSGRHSTMIAPAIRDVALSSRSPRPFSMRERLEACTCGLYLVWTISLSVWFLALLEPSLTNNLYWSHYNVSGYGGLLIDLANHELTIARNGSVDLTASDFVVHKMYSQSLVPLAFQSTYARNVLFTELNTLDHVIRSLRNATDTYFVFAQYCWLDFDRRWDVAHTAGRSTRCTQRYTDNAASYIETLVRNINWTGFMAAVSDMWHVAFAVELQQSDEGLEWLADRPVDSLRLGVDDEIAYLMSMGLTRFDLQWQNSAVVAITETLVVENALGIRQPITIKGSPPSFGLWTSEVLFWNFFNDLYMCPFSNVSLIRSAANSCDKMGLPVANYLGVQDSTGDFVRQAGVFFYQLGPFSSVDAYVVKVPRPLLTLYTAFQSKLYQTLWSNRSMLAAFEAIRDISLTLLPPNFAIPGLTFFGGNVLCLHNPATAFPQSMLSFDDACAAPSQFTITASNEAVLFALLVSGATEVTNSMCAFQSTPGCEQTIAQANSLLVQMDLHDNAIPSIPLAQASIPPLQFVQYAQDDSGPWLFLQQPLLTAVPAWSFYGWLAIFDWVQGTREVVRLEGDVTTIVLISEPYPNVALVGHSDTSRSTRDTQMVFYLMIYVSLALATVATVVLTYVILVSAPSTGRNLLQFNRVVGPVWIGRPLLLLRGFMAILLLSTSQVHLTRVDDSDYSKFVIAPRSIFATIVVVGEATWVAYILSDILLVGTSHRLARYTSPAASGLAWLVSVVLETTCPIPLLATLDRQCTALLAASFLSCESGFIRVGAWNRIVVLVLVQGGSTFITWLFGACFFNRSGRRPQPASLLVHGSAQAFLHLRQQSHDDTWHLDSIGCAMGGIILWAFRGQRYSFDIKLWIFVHEGSVTSHRTSGVSFKRPIFDSPTRAVAVQARVFPAESSQADSWPSEKQTWWSRLKVLAGLGYVVLTALGSVSYIALSNVNFANNFFWATFNMTGHHVAMANWFNEQVSLGRNLSLIRLDEPQWGFPDVDFSRIATKISSSVNIPPRFLFETLNTLPIAIRGLRNTNSCSIPWVFTQYCWLDFNRQWSVANSDARQLRCYNDISNGALYLESALRNIDWNIWTSCWGTSFDIAFGNELHKSRVGQNWVTSVQTNTLSVNNEVVYWTNAGIQHYTVQWQNYKTT
ncbi:hypothetical protein As57867_011475, partial [Aphanomyces stellatus]